MQQLDQLILHFRAWRESMPLSFQLAFDFVVGMVVVRGFVVPAIVSGIKKIFNERERLAFRHFHGLAKDVRPKKGPPSPFL